MLIFIDMDGVVADFDAHMLECFGLTMEEMTEQEKEQFWNVECVSKQFFANAPLIPEGLHLVRTLRSARFELSFLTSTGGGKHHLEIAKQKLEFLERNHFDDMPVAFATGTKSKASYANAGTLLVDDRQKVVDAFKSAGGNALLFTRENWGDIVSAVAGNDWKRTVLGWCDR
jgi:hypothetical protein